MIPSSLYILRVDAEPFAEMSATDDFFEFFYRRPGMFRVDIVDSERRDTSQIVYPTQDEPGCIDKIWRDLDGDIFGKNTACQPDGSTDLFSPWHRECSMGVAGFGQKFWIIISWICLYRL